MQEKLDFLMTLTDTRNSVLGKALSFDPSYISRLRSGKRSISRNHDFLHAASDYFARRLRDGERLSRLQQAMGREDTLPGNQEELSEIIFHWMNDGGHDSNPSASIGNMLKTLSKLPELHNRPSVPPMPPVISHKSNMEVYFGEKGKREGVEVFLSGLLSSNSAHTLFLYSNESMSWLINDRDFAMRWALMLHQLLSSGSRIQIIHTLDRSRAELFEAVSKWLPLYADGSIEPFYYPFPQSDTCRRSLFIAKGETAIFSSSVGDRLEKMPNILIRDKAVVSGLEQEYRNYLEMCSPLVRIFRKENRASFFKYISLFGKDEAPHTLFIAHSLPSFFTMPEEVVRNFSHSQTDDNMEVMHKSASEALLRHMRDGGTITEILHLPPAEELRENPPALPMGDFSIPEGKPELPRYTATSLYLHFQNLIRLLEEQENYRVVLSEQIPENVLLYAKEGCGAMLVCTVPKALAFYVDEENMTAALLNYLGNAANSSSGESQEETLQKLRAYAEMLTRQA